jgi:hypothetical protein
VKVIPNQLIRVRHVIFVIIIYFHFIHSHLLIWLFKVNTESQGAGDGDGDLPSTANKSTSIDEEGEASEMVQGRKRVSHGILCICSCCTWLTKNP